MKMAIKSGDQVVVIAGKEKGKQGRVMEIDAEKNRITIENVNMVTKHQKPRSQQDKGGKITKAAPIDASNAMVICPVCGKATRVGHRVIEGEKVRSCKKCNGSLDKKFEKQTKKEVKKTEKTAKKVEAHEKSVTKTTEAKTPAVKKVTSETKAKTAAKSTAAKKSTKKVSDEK